MCVFFTQSKTAKGAEFTDTFGNGSKVLTLATGSPGILVLVKAMTDSSTFVVRKNQIRNLKVLFDHDPVLINVYHALIASPEKYPHTHHMLAEKFVKFMVSPEGQIIMKNFGKQKYGFPLYWDAEYAQKWEK